MTDRPNTTSELSQSLRSTITRSAPSPSRGEMGTRCTRIASNGRQCDLTIAAGEDEHGGFCQAANWPVSIAPATEERALDLRVIEAWYDGFYPHGASETIVRDWVGELLSALRSSRRREEELRDALKPFASFAERWEENPLRGIADELYAIHTGENGAALRLSDCRRAAALLASRSSLEGSQQ